MRIEQINLRLLSWNRLDVIAVCFVREENLTTMAKSDEKLEDVGLLR